MVVGGARSDHVQNHIQLLGNGVLSPHGVGISHPDQTELDGGVIGMSAADSAYLTGSKVPFTVALRGGQVVLDLFAPDNHDQLKVLLSDGGQANVSMCGDGHTGSELVVRLHYAPGPADVFTVVEVAGTTAITGKFSNGDKVTATFGTKTYEFDIQYNVGADGNDIALANAMEKSGGTLVTIR